MDDDELCPACDAHRESAFEDRISEIGIVDPTKEGRETDPDLEDWFAARQDDLEEQRFALADLETERWSC